MKKVKILLIAVISLVSLNSFAQNEAEEIADKLDRLATTYAKEYVKPINNALGSNINSGLFHNVNITSPSKLGLNIR